MSLSEVHALPEVSTEFEKFSLGSKSLHVVVILNIKVMNMGLCRSESVFFLCLGTVYSNTLSMCLLSSFYVHISG